MRAHIAGSTGTILCQTNAVRAGFTALGHEHVDDPFHPDSAFTFVGNASYDDYMSHIGRKKTIFNVLDCPTWVSEWPSVRAKWATQLAAADRVTCISETVHADIQRYFGINAQTIYYPMKPVRHTGERKYPQFRVALVGRLCDPAKRAGFAVQALVRAGFKSEEVAIVGPEYLGWGTRIGITDDATLNDIYNSVDYVVSMSYGEGIGLPPIEAACCGAIPIVAPDLTTFNEFWVNSPLGLHYQMLNSVDSVAALITSIEKDGDWKAQLKRDFLIYANTHFRPKFEATEVARRIIEVYQTIQ